MKIHQNKGVMNMKKSCAIIVSMMIMASVCPRLAAQEISGSASVILNHYSARNFITGAIPDAHLNAIIQAGVRAPSAANLQPWRFTVVRTLSLAQKLVPQAVEGNVLIVVSAAGDGKTNAREIIDCALAVQSMYLAAQALGYGSRIYTGPITKLNSDYKGDLGIPAGSSAVALVRIGKVQAGADAVSTASPRKKAEELVTYK
jgi:nitroreductase